jgi:cobalt-zinc-cadmium efflux system membrane fusion protein
MDQDDHERRGRRLRRGLAAGLAALAFTGLGVAGGYVWSERQGATAVGVRGSAPEGSGPAPTAIAPMSGMPGMPETDKPATPAEDSKKGEPVEVTLTPEAVERAGIKIALVRSEAATIVISVPATVTSNAYRDTKVNALVGGLVRQVHVELGAAVERGRPLAIVFSAELAEAQMKYVSMGAMLEADHRKLERTRKLFELGAASRQELEEVTAVHAGHASEVAAARQRLLLLGLSADQVGRLQDASQVVSEATVSAPSRGVVIARSVNPGQVVMAGQNLFVVADLGTVWVIGDVYEKDVPSVRLGAEATVTVPFGGRGTLRGRVAYIDPRVEPATRTTKVRVEVPNPDGSLRLGMFVTVSVRTGAGGSMTLVPRAAVQWVGDRSVVYVPAGENEPRFLERAVKLGQVVGDHVQVREGLTPGQKVVTESSFLLRAEAARARSGG